MPIRIWEPVVVFEQQRHGGWTEWGDGKRKPIRK
jgi:hypothetical protein